MHKNKTNIIKLTFIILLVVLPWFNASFVDDIKPVPLIQEDNSFFEINTCKISIGEFFAKNIKYTYQNHYFFDFNNNSSISCFGRITGVSINNEGFFISVGSNPLVNLILQSSFWLILFSFIKKSDKKFELNIGKNYILVFLSTYLFTYSIYAEQRYYSGNIYLFSFDELSSYFLLFIIFLWININLVSIMNERFDRLIYFLPLMYLVSGIFLGSNISIYSMLIVYYGIYSISSTKYLRRFNCLYLLFSFVWLFNSTGRFYLQPGKFRGFTNSIYEFNSNLFWIILFCLVCNGIFFLYKKTSDSINIFKFMENWSNLGIPLVFLGIIGAHFPLINFLLEYYFGLQRNVTRQLNPFAFNEYSEKIAWRGIFPSAETIGEYFGISLIFLFALYVKNKRLNKLNTLSLVFALLGLYFSDNRAAGLLVLIFIIYIFIDKSKYRKTSLVFGSLFILSVFIIIVGFQNFQFPLEYTSTFVFNRALDYKVHYETSSFLEYLNFSYNNKTFFSWIFGLVSMMSFILNRSELWAIISARFNPTYSEVLFGTGPLTFGHLYGEINISQTNSFLLPHSSVFSYILFFGLFGTIVLFLALFYKYFFNRKKIGTLGSFLILFILANITKNDSLNYLSSFSNYLILFLLIFNASFSKVSRR